MDLYLPKQFWLQDPLHPRAMYWDKPGARCAQVSSNPNHRELDVIDRVWLGKHHKCLLTQLLLYALQSRDSYYCCHDDNTQYGLSQLKLGNLQLKPTRCRQTCSATILMYFRQEKVLSYNARWTEEFGFFVLWNNGIFDCLVHTHCGPPLVQSAYCTVPGDQAILRRSFSWHQPQYSL